ncbi:peptidoglycan-binding protein [Streptomyces sp. NRRL S-350]|uniref:peptidoglycan-binding protein n=1 Tax=Streptomyces sp. NRRL S-350 TaxID=1463902 RepID=UPI0004BFF9A0|nr:peptidoglycan-binding protein [Streptomyces sp. NRRL S-350]
MAWYPNARKLELQPESDAQPAIRPTQVIFHSIAAPWSGERTYQYWRDSTNLESHFYAGFGGEVYQYIGTETRADANMYANRRNDGTGAVSVETASNLDHSDPWTDAQIEALIGIGVWMHNQHGVPLRICQSWTDPGFGIHRMYPQWSQGGTACPGDVRAAQFRDRVFPGIVAAVNGGGSSGGSGDDGGVAPFPGAWFFQSGRSDDLITRMGQRLVEEGCGRYSVGPGPDWGPADQRSYAAWQRACGYSGSAADGIPGQASWDRLRVPNN